MSLPTILVVDDDPMVTQMLGMLLDLSLSAKVVTTNSSLQAREILQGGGVTLLLTDHLMPDLNGINLARSLRNEGSRLPIILLTGYCDEPELISNVEALMPFEVLFKPWNSEVLLQRIQYWLNEAV